MKKLFKKNMNFYQKFVLAIVFAGILPVGILATGVMTTFLQDYKKMLSDNYNQAITYAAMSVENLVNSYNEVTKLCYSYNSNNSYPKSYTGFSDLLNIVDGINYEGIKDSESLQAEDMDSFLRYIMYTDPKINNVFFYDSRQKLYRYTRQSSKFKDESLLIKILEQDKVKKNGKELTILPSHKDDYFVKENEFLLTFARNYLDLNGVVGKERYVGTLYIEANLSEFDNIFRNMDISKTGEVYVLDESNQCIYSNEKYLIGQPVGNRIKQLKQKDKRDNYLVERKIQDLDWSIVFSVEYDTVFANIKKIQSYMYSVMLIALAALLMTSIIFSKKLTRPIREMMKQMGNIESGNFDVQLPITSNDEIGILSKRFNLMSQQLKEYINKSYRAQIKQKESELTALKSQIYPHFLYNTLEVIRMTAIDHNDDMVSGMIESLSDQIRYIIGTVNDKVCLLLEVDILKKYIYLINCRFEGKVTFEVQLKDLADYEIPKLILQPMIENAFVHGIRPKDGKGTIMLMAQRHDNIVEISVFDNGVGMEPFIVEKMEALLQSDQPGNKNEYNWENIGLKNVHDRIRYLYGEEYGIKISSTVNIGTIVKITMPFIKKKTS